MGKTAPFDKKLLEFATDRERVLLETWANEGTQTKAAKVLQVTQHSISAYKRARKRAEIRGYSPQHKLQHAVPATQLLKGASTLYDENGNVRLQWVKSESKPAGDTSSTRTVLLPDLLTTCVQGLVRLHNVARGLQTRNLRRITRSATSIWDFTWGSETGSEDYDLAKSSADIVGGLSFLIDAAPPTQTGVLVNVGDFYTPMTAKPNARQR